MKKMLVFIGGIAVGILASTGGYALDDVENNVEDCCCDDKIELEEMTTGEDAGENNNC